MEGEISLDNLLGQTEDYWTEHRKGTMETEILSVGHVSFVRITVYKYFVQKMLR